MNVDLPEPLVPSEVDLRDVPVPIAAFVELAMQELGMDRETAEREVRAAAARAAARAGIPSEEVGHG